MQLVIVQDWQFFRSIGEVSILWPRPQPLHDSVALAETARYAGVTPHCRAPPGWYLQANFMSAAIIRRQGYLGKTCNTRHITGNTESYCAALTKAIIFCGGGASLHMAAAFTWLSSFGGNSQICQSDTLLLSATWVLYTGEVHECCNGLQAGFCK